MDHLDPCPLLCCVTSGIKQCGTNVVVCWSSNTHTSPPQQESPNSLPPLLQLLTDTLDQTGTSHAATHAEVRID